VILVDGKRSDHLNVLDRGFAYGDGVFRTMRAAQREIPFWARHYRKLASDCAVLGITCPDEELLRRELNEVLRSETDCILKVTVTRGLGGRGYAVPLQPTVTRIVASFPLPPVPSQYHRSGVRARWCNMRLSIQPRLAGVKHLNRLENVLARSEWNDSEIAEGLMLDTEANVIAGTYCNLFLFEQGRLVTPDLSGCGIAGVQRERVFEAAIRLGIACSVEAISRARVCNSDQVLLVNSVIGLWWVSALDEWRWQRCEHTAALGQCLEKLGD